MDTSGSSSLCFDSSMDASSSSSVCLDSSVNMHDSVCFDSSSSMEEDSPTSGVKDDRSLGVDDNFDTPLYPGSTMTYFESHLQVFQYALRHRLTKTAFSDLLNLIDAHLPPSNCMLSLYKLKKHFLQLYKDITYTTHFCCSNCHASLSTLESPCPNQYEEEAMEFLSISIAPQLKRRLEDPVFWSNLQKRFTRTSEPGVLSDVLDGKEYRKHHDFVSRPANVTLTLNTDGVSLFRSSSMELWPIWLAINELPPTLRYKRKNMILAGIWFGRSKPTMTTFLEPLVDQLKILSSIGFMVNTPHGETTSKAMLLMCSVDLHARASVMNMKLFNGKYACAYCEDEGVPRPTSHLHRNWPYTTNSTPRTHQSILRNARDALRSDDAVMGIKGASILCSLPSFNLCTGVVIDVMHCVFLGVIDKTLMGFWFSTTHRSSPFSLRKHMARLNDKLRKIQAPVEFSRPVRTLQDLPHWKASEHRSWLLYYSLPVLHGILPEPYITHYSLLVAAVHLLLSDKVSQEMLDKAEQYLKRFYGMFAALYGDNGCTMNVHMLKHLPECVTNWGPLWAYSCFQFESVNGHLKSHYHGTKAMNSQLAFSYVMLQLVAPKSEPSQAIVLSDCRVTGGVKMIRLEQEVREMLQRKFSVDSNVASQFTRAVIDGREYYSQAYPRVTKRNSYTVCYKEGGVTKYGLIKYFLSLPSQSVAVINVLTPTSAFCYPQRLTFLHSRIVPIKLESTTDIVSVRSLMCKCVYISLSNTNMYVSVLANCITDD